jgi:histidinol-phosphate aminotransferase
MTLIQGIPDPGPGLRLHLNENTGGCSPRVVEAVRSFTGAALSIYPDFKTAVPNAAAHLGVDPDWLVLTNGLDEGVLLTSIAYLGPRTPKALADAGAPFVAPGGQAEVVVVAPAFETYIASAKGMGARIVSVPHGPDFVFPLDAVLRAVTANTRLVFINTPHNPSGAVVPKTAIRRIVDEAGHALVFLDEAYHDFAGDDFLAEAHGHHNVIIGRTLSKAYGLAGIRIGLLIAPPLVLEPIRYVMPVFNLNVIAIAALQAALADTEFRPWYLAQVKASKELLYPVLNRLGLRYWPSAANFVLIDGGPRARDLVDGLHQRRIFVKDRTTDPHCPNCFRLTTGVVEHTQDAIRALEELCAAAR